MNQEEFNQMLAVAIAQGIGGGTYISKYSGEEIDALLDKVAAMDPPAEGGSTQ